MLVRVVVWYILSSKWGPRPCVLTRMGDKLHTICLARDAIQYVRDISNLNKSL